MSASVVNTPRTPKTDAYFSPVYASASHLWLLFAFQMNKNSYDKSMNETKPKSYKRQIIALCVLILLGFFTTFAIFHKVAEAPEPNDPTSPMSNGS